AANHGELLTLNRFTDIVSGGEAKGAFDWRLPLRDEGRYGIVGSKGFGREGGRYGIVGSRVLGEYGWAGVGLAALGVVALVLRAWRARGGAELGALVGVGLPIAGYLFFALAFNVPDPDFSAFFIPLHLMAALLMGVGVQWLMAIAGRVPRL